MWVRNNRNKQKTTKLVGNSEQKEAILETRHSMFNLRVTQYGIKLRFSFIEGWNWGINSFSSYSYCSLCNCNRNQYDKVSHGLSLLSANDISVTKKHVFILCFDTVTATCLSMRKSLWFLWMLNAPLSKNEEKNIFYINCRRK